jgi:hypothetical protein
MTSWATRRGPGVRVGVLREMSDGTGDNARYATPHGRALHIALCTRGAHYTWRPAPRQGGKRMTHDPHTQGDPTAVPWLSGGGEMGALIRALD